LSNDTDAPFIGAYSEERATQLALVTTQGKAYTAFQAGNEVEAYVQPLRITPPARPALGQAWIGNTEIAVSTVLENLPRIVTTPGDLTDTQIRAQIEQYIEMVIDLLGIYLPIAALKGYSESDPKLSGYVENYLANIGAKPWQRRQMQTIFRSLPMPKALVGYMMAFYAVKKHPRIDNFHHFIPPVGSTTAEAFGGAAIVANDWFQNEYLRMKNLITDYEEFVSLLKLGGYQTMDIPDALPVISDAHAWEKSVNNACFSNYDFQGTYGAGLANLMVSLPNEQHKNRTLTVQRYVEDLGPELARGLAPMYYYPQATGYDSAAYSGTNQGAYTTDTYDMALIASMGQYPMASIVSGGVMQSRAGYLDWAESTGIPEIFPNNSQPGTTQTLRMAKRIASSNARITNEINELNNDQQWAIGARGEGPLAGELEIYFSTTQNPNTYIPATSSTTAYANIANLQQVYRALLLP
jgi:hypothetical protein